MKTGAEWGSESMGKLIAFGGFVLCMHYIHPDTHTYSISYLTELVTKYVYTRVYCTTYIRKFYLCTYFIMFNFLKDRRDTLRVLPPTPRPPRRR
jgi:hypothetical protein